MNRPPVRIAVIGSLDVTVWGRPVEIPRGVSSRLLLVLAAEHGRVVRDERLISLLWPEDRTPRTIGALRNAAMRLRRALGDASAAVVRERDGYRLADDVRLDTKEFAELARTEPDRALGLVRGRPFDDVLDESWALPVVTSWVEQIAIVEERVAARIVAAGDSSGVHELERQATHHPEREVRWVNLMSLLTATGRRAEALRALRRARSALADYGLSPGADLLRLEQVALGARHDPAVGDAEASLDVIGREALIGEVVAALHVHRVVSLTGLGGVGKTTVARAVWRHLGESTDERIFVDLTDIDDGGLVPAELLTAAGVTGEAPGVDIVDLFALAIASRPTLVVIDNAEQVADAVRSLVVAIVDRCPTARVLITSRDRLGVVVEHVVTVPPFPTPPNDGPAEDWAGNPGVQLLFRRCSRLIPSDVPDAARLVRAVVGLPLGIELVAGLLARIPIADVAAFIDGDVPVLDLDGLGRHPRHRLEAVFEFAVNRLSTPDRRAFGRLGVLTAPFTANTAQALVAVDDQSGPPVLATLARLAEASLLHIQPGEPTCFSLLPLQRAAANLAADPVDRRDAFDAATTWYRGLVAELGHDLRTARQIAARRVLECEFRNVRWLIRTLIRAGRHDDALALAGDLRDFWALGDHQAEGIRLLTDVIAASSGSTSLGRAAALVALPRATATYAGVARHRTLSLEAVEIAESHGSAPLVAEARLYLGQAEGWNGESAAFDTLEQVANQHDNEWAAISALTSIALLRIISGAVDEGRRAIAEAVRRRQACGDRFGEALTHLQAGMALERHGDSTEAEKALLRSIEVAGTDIAIVTAHARYSCALIGRDRGEPDTVTMLTAVREHFRQVGDLGCFNGSGRALADAAVQSGDRAAALEVLREGLWMMPSIDDQETAASFVQVAEIYLADGHRGAASVLLATARQLAAGTGIGWNERQWERLEDATLDAGAAAPVDAQEAVRIALEP